MSDLAMGGLGGTLKFREMITGRYADVLSWMYLVFSTLRRFEAEGRRKEDLPFVHFAMRYSFDRIQEAFDGIFNFSTIPLNVIFGMGMVVAAGSIVTMIVLFLQRLLDFKILGWGYQQIPGFTTLVVALLFFSGAQLISIGILGSYIGRIYQEVRRRPRFVIREIIEGTDLPRASGSD